MNTSTRHVVMLASENDSLRSGKVGGVGDVARDLPRALASLGWRVTVVVPTYGFLHKENPSRLIGSVTFPFAGKETTGELYEATPRNDHPGVTNLLFHHPAILGEPIYCNDPPAQAFAKDATKYALFCSAIGTHLLTRTDSFVLHLHDWHMGFLLLLRELHPSFAGLKKIRTVFTIHNLAIQGTRPIRGPVASVEEWFPELFRKTDWIRTWADPRYKEASFTPMAAGIRFADKVNTVSPTYAREILLPSDQKQGIYRGEGLETYLQAADREKRLFGILNGTEYPQGQVHTLLSFEQLCDVASREVQRWKSKKADDLHDEVLARVDTLRGRKPNILFASVTRVTDQKVRLMYERGTNEVLGIDEIMQLLTKRNGVYFFLGSGTTDYEDRLIATFRKFERFVFFRGYSDAIAEALYVNANLFMMPSSFEPCGIGQMVAMRHGQPCVVNAVGGLKDTVIDGHNGFTFTGATLDEQIDAFVATVNRALTMFFDDRERWKAIVETATKSRYTWEGSAREYATKLYQ